MNSGTSLVWRFTQTSERPLIELQGYSVTIGQNKGYIAHGECFRQTDGSFLVKGIADFAKSARQSAVSKCLKVTNDQIVTFYHLPKREKYNWVREMFPSKTPEWLPQMFTEQRKISENKKLSLLDQLNMIYVPGMNEDELDVAYMEQFGCCIPASQNKFVDYFLSKKLNSFRELLEMEFDILDHGDQSFVSISQFVETVLQNAEIHFPENIQDQFNSSLNAKKEKILVCKILYAITLSHNRRKCYADNLPSLVFYGLPNCGKSILVQEIPKATNTAESVSMLRGVGKLEIHRKSRIACIDDITFNEFIAHRDFFTATLSGARYEAAVYSSHKSNPVVWALMSTNELTLPEMIKSNSNNSQLMYLGRRLVCIQCTTDMREQVLINCSEVDKFVHKTISENSREFMKLYQKFKNSNTHQFWNILNKYVKSYLACKRDTIELR